MFIGMKHIILVTILALFFSFSVFAQSEKSPCPEIDISIDANKIFNPTEPMLFTVKVGDEAKNLVLGYAWTVSQGKIIEGQGTPSIKVDIEKLYDTNITATVEIKGLPENCANVESETGSSYRHYSRAILFDEFGKLRDGEVKERLDAFFMRLSEDSNFQGYIIFYGSDKEIAAREKQIRKAIDLLKYDSIRVTLVRGGANPNGTGVWTKAWIVPPGVDNPKP